MSSSIQTAVRGPIAARGVDSRAKEIFRINNFDLIRLMAAAQVAIVHATTHLQAGVGSLLYSAVRFFPGVPIFFFVSGFLISRSYENNSVLKEYARNRALRIFPALIACTLLSVAAVYFTGYFNEVRPAFSQLMIWIGAQISFVQFYNPGFMKGFGVGVLNGSLWTISVELQFYFVIPVVYRLIRAAGPGRGNAVLIALFVLALGANTAYYGLLDRYGELLLFKLWGVSFAPWVHMFFVGIFFQRNFNTFYRFLQGRAVYLFAAYLAVHYWVAGNLGWATGNRMNWGLYLLFAGLIFSLAYSMPTLSRRALKNNDISYGVYIYHMPVVNLFIYYGYASNLYYVYAALALTVLTAIISWSLVERPSMKLKKHPFNSLKPREVAVVTGLD